MAATPQNLSAGVQKTRRHPPSLASARSVETLRMWGSRATIHHLSKFGKLLPLGRGGVDFFFLGLTFCV